MANKNLLTYNAKVSTVEQDYFAPIAVLPITGLPISTIFAFLSRVDPWTDENNPNQPTQDQQYIKNVFKNIFVCKQVLSNQISPVIYRFDWTLNTTYNYYRDDIDMFAQNSDGTLVQNFYVRNSYDQVFKCLWNNNNQPSTIMPFFQPGSYGTNNIFQSSDGYKWKYIYTIDSGTKKTFMDSKWMPVPVGGNTPGPVLDNNGNQVGSWAGSIDVINVTNGGSGYQNDVAVNVVINGDGTGATGTAVVSGGQITDIIVTNPGSNYSYATVSITSASGSGATAISPVSPIGGHGYDAVSDFGCNHVMLTCEFDGSENGKIPTDIDYRQVGILINPVSKSSYPNPANNIIYNTTTQFFVAPGFGSYNSDEIVYQGSSVNNASFTGTVLSFDVGTNILSVINTTGTPTLNSPVFGNSSTTVRTLLTVNNPDLLLPSGYMSYIENRTGVQRSADGIEQLKIVLGY